MHACRQPLSANLVVDSSNPRARGTGGKGALGAVVKQHMLPWAGVGGDSRSATLAPSTYRLALAACTRVQRVGTCPLQISAAPKCPKHVQEAKGTSRNMASNLMWSWPVFPGP